MYASGKFTYVPAKVPGGFGGGGSYFYDCVAHQRRRVVYSFKILSIGKIENKDIYRFFIFLFLFFFILGRYFDEKYQTTLQTNAFPRCTHSKLIRHTFQIASNVFRYKVTFPGTRVAKMCTSVNSQNLSSDREIVEKRVRVCIKNMRARVKY